VSEKESDAIPLSIEQDHPCHFPLESLFRDVTFITKVSRKPDAAQKL